MATRMSLCLSPAMNNLREAGSGPVETLKFWLSVPSGMTASLCDSSVFVPVGRAAGMMEKRSCPYAGTIRIRFKGFPRRPEIAGPEAVSQPLGGAPLGIALSHRTEGRCRQALVSTEGGFSV